MSEPAERPLSTAIQALKLGFARRVIGEPRRQHPSELIESGAQRIWQARYYDFNVSPRRSGSRNSVTSIAIRSSAAWWKRRNSGAGVAFARMPIWRSARSE